MSGPVYVIYGSGDLGTAKLRDQFFQKKIPIEFRDLRHRDVNGDLANLIEFERHNLGSIPQTFAPDGCLIGDFEATERHLKMTFSFGESPCPIAA